MHTPTARRPPHLGGCGWFWAWAVVGVVGAVGLDIVLAPPVAGALAYGLTRFRGSRTHTEGMLTGAVRSGGETALSPERESLRAQN